MDIERTMEFIWNAQAKAEVRMDKIDKRLDSITKLVHQGMRILVRNSEETAHLRKDMKEQRKQTKEEMTELRKEFRKEMQELAKAQKATERTLKAFIHSMTHGRNGNNQRHRKASAVTSQSSIVR